MRPTREMRPRPILSLGLGGTIVGGGIGTSPGQLDWIVVTDPDYGAVGDGATDDTAAITAAFAACPTGGTVYFPVPSVAYKITSAITVPTAMHLLGGNGNFIGTTTTEDVSKIVQDTANTSAFISEYGLHVEGLQITGDIGGQSAGAALEMTSSIIVRNCLIQGFQDGLRITTTSSADPAFYSTVETSFFDSASRAGVRLSGIVNNFTWIKCRAVAGQYGVQITGGPLQVSFFGGDMGFNSVASLWIDGQTGGTGINTAGVLVSGVYFEQEDGDPDILIGPNTSVRGVTVIGCSFIKSSLSGTGWHIDAEDVDGLSVIGNEFNSSDAVRVVSPGTNVLYANNHNLNAGTVTLPADAIRLDPDEFIVPESIAGSPDAGTSHHLARADHVHDGTTIADFDDLGDVTITDPAAGEMPRWNGSAWINDTGMICVDPGTMTVDEGPPFGVTVESDWGIDGTTPYYDAAGAADGEEAALFYDPLIDNYTLVAYDF